MESLSLIPVPADTSLSVVSPEGWGQPKAELTAMLQEMSLLLVLLLTASGIAAAQQWVGPIANVTAIPPGKPHVYRHDVNSTAECASICHASTNCSAYTYQPLGLSCKSGQIVPKQARLCYLMDKFEGVHACPGHVSGYVSPPTPPPTPHPFPVPTARQLQWMQGAERATGGFSQFMHFSIPTFWTEGDKFDPADTYHNCAGEIASNCDEASCGNFAPCLHPRLFNPADLDAEQWVLAAKALGVQEICLTAQHEGGFALWPSAHTDYSVAAATQWRNGSGDVLRDFADACNKHGMGICYYLHPSCDHYSTMVANVSAKQFSERQLGKITEALTRYGPVNRLWFDGKGGATGPGTRYPVGLDLESHYQKVLSTVRELSPNTLVTGYREWGGDLGSSYHSLHLFDSTLTPNTTSMASVGSPSEQGARFFPLEQVGICMQEGPDGNTNTNPTFWFHHPKIGHANASRIFESWVNIVGHAENAMVNIPPGRSGKLDPAYVAVMQDVGKAIRDTFGTPVAQLGATRARCDEPVVLQLGSKSSGFDYIETREDTTKSQRIMNYTIEYTADGSSWSTLVPPVVNPPKMAANMRRVGLGDRPAGADARDNYVGFRRIDVPAIDAGATATAQAIRFRCLRSLGDDIYLESLAVFRRRVPWEAREL